MVGPADVQHAARCATAWHFHQADPDHEDVDADAAQRRIGALMVRVRDRTDHVTHLWLPFLVVLAAAAVALAHFLLQERGAVGYIIIVTALVLLQCGAALLTLQWSEEARRRKAEAALGAVPAELGGSLPMQVGPVTDDQWELEGPVGTVVHVGDRTVPVITVDGRSAKGVDPWVALRAGASMRLLEVRDGEAPEYGLVAYDDGIFRVDYHDVRGPLKVMVDGLNDDPPPRKRDHDTHRRCTTCPWRMPCSQALS